ncbi:MAG: tetratricopeptide repeat protein, partial [Planctomycetota bacterium]
MPASSKNRRGLSPTFVWRMLLVAIGMASVGCAAFRHKSPIPEAVATCRQYSREGVTAMETGHWSEAESLLRQALGASPTDADTRRHLAETLWTRGEHEEAITHMKSAAELEPNNPEAAVRYGEMLLARGRYDDALEQARIALQINQRLASAWALRGRAHHSLGD